MRNKQRAYGKQIRNLVDILWEKFVITLKRLVKLWLHILILCLIVVIIILFYLMKRF